MKAKDQVLNSEQNKDHFISHFVIVVYLHSTQKCALWNKCNKFYCIQKMYNSVGNRLTVEKVDKKKLLSERRNSHHRK